MTKNKISIFLIIYFLFSGAAPIEAQENRITIHYNEITGDVNRKIFGNNSLGYISQDTPSDFSNADYGAGTWDPKWNKLNLEIIKLAREAGVSVLRFPGGCGAHHYRWKEAIGRDRDSFKFGIDEFLKLCENVGCEAIFTISYFEGNEQDAADLVEYLNTPYLEKTDMKHVWALKRAQNGHPEPYGVKYFEIGNEDWHGDHLKIKSVTPEEYSERYLKYYDAIKRVDPSVMVGVILDSPEWNRKVIEAIKDKVDFGIVHIYPNAGATGKKLEDRDPKDVFRIAWTVTVSRYGVDFKRIHELFKKYAGKEVSIAVTEYNGGFAQEKPVPYRHTLGTAIINAELIKVFLNPENGIFLANYWQFVNEYWGMIANGFNGKYGSYHNPYFRRPNYYVYNLYYEHFGDKLIKVDIYSDSYAFKDYGFFLGDIMEEIHKDRADSAYALKIGIKIDNEKRAMFVPYLSVIASRDIASKKIYLIVINKNMGDAMTAEIDLKDFAPAAKGNAWALNGPSVDATNEKKHDNVKVTHWEFEIKGNPFEFTFEPHSLTAIKIDRK